MAGTSPGITNGENVAARLSDSNVKQLRHVTAFPRRVFARVLQSRCPSASQRAQGKPGADCARSPVCESATEDAHGLNYRYSQDIPAFPAQWFYGFLRAPRGSGLSCPRCQREALTNVAPGSRRQDHTTSPHAASVFVRAVCTALTPQRPSQPAPRSVTIARTSLMVRGLRRVMDLIHCSEKQNISALPSGQAKSA